MEYNISWEINVEADSPLEAAKIAQKWMDKKVTLWQFYVQDDETKEIFNVNLANHNDPIYPITDYKPIIEI